MRRASSSRDCSRRTWVASQASVAAGPVREIGWRACGSRGRRSRRRPQRPIAGTRPIPPRRARAESSRRARPRAARPRRQSRRSRDRVVPGGRPARAPRPRSRRPRARRPRPARSAIRRRRILSARRSASRSSIEGYRSAGCDREAALQGPADPSRHRWPGGPRSRGLHRARRARLRDPTSSDGRYPNSASYRETQKLN